MTQFCKAPACRRRWPMRPGRTHFPSLWKLSRQPFHPAIRLGGVKRRSRKQLLPRGQGFNDGSHGADRMHSGQKDRLIEKHPRPAQRSLVPSRHLRLLSL